MPSKTSSASPDAEEIPKTPKKGKMAAPKKSAASAKKRKMAEVEAEDEDAEEDVEAESDD